MTRLSVAVIGSFRRHYSEVVTVVREFEAFGVTVTTPGVSKIINPGNPYVRFETDAPHISDQLIQAATLEKIFEADLVYVVAPSGYIGYATWYELGRVHERGIPVYYSEVPRDVPIDVPPGAVLGIPDLIRKELEQGDPW